MLSNKNIPHRIVIYPKDIMLLTGKSERYSREILKKIKSHFKKEEHQIVTIKELCQYFGIEQNEIYNLLK
jgi:siroheme synthase (precorrin-2 oxidase/ferrochelatase)